jgi:hypothetical protein
MVKNAVFSTDTFWRGTKNNRQKYRCVRQRKIGGVSRIIQKNGGNYRPILGNKNKRNILSETARVKPQKTFRCF